MAKGKDKEHAEAKRPQGSDPRRRLPGLAWPSIALVLIVAGVLIGMYGAGEGPPDKPEPPRAAIVDQLSVLLMNETFITEVTTELEEFGFEVDLYQGDEITVDLYRELPTRNYKLIIFRAHSGIMGEGDEAHVETVIFTNERYNRLRHWSDQIAGRLRMATVGIYQPIVFGIPPEFITDSMIGRFDDAVVIMMGCSGSYLDDLAMSFVEKGALAYLGWDDIVGLHYVDRATAYLVRQLCSEGLTIEEAVAGTMAHIGADPTYKAELSYYPSLSGGRTL
ncbi:MAG: hypothetical protein ACNA7X_04455 [Dehalococcoidia bacterium]